MTEVRQATDLEQDAWRQEWRGRLQSWYDAADVTPEWAGAQIDRRIANRQSAAISTTLAIASNSTWVGILALSAGARGDAKVAVVDDIWIAPEHRRHGHATRALGHAADWCKDNGASVWATTNPGDPAHAALFAGYPIRAHQMIKRLTLPEPLAAGLTGGPMSEAEFAAWRDEAVRGYAADMTDSGAISAELAYAEAARQFDQLLPDGIRTANHSFLCLYADGDLVATNWIGHGFAPGTSWVYGVEVNEGHRGKGYGRAAMAIGEQAALAVGDSHLGLNVFGHNTVAISLYNAMGYRAYEHARSVDI